jgi:hypothetical protein
MRPGSIIGEQQHALCTLVAAALPSGGDCRAAAAQVAAGMERRCAVSAARAPPSPMRLSSAGPEWLVGEAAVRRGRDGPLAAAGTQPLSPDPAAAVDLAAGSGCD